MQHCFSHKLLEIIIDESDGSLCIIGRGQCGLALLLDAGLGRTLPPLLASVRLKLSHGLREPAARDPRQDEQARVCGR